MGSIDIDSGGDTSIGKDLVGRDKLVTDLGVHISGAGVVNIIYSTPVSASSTVAKYQKVQRGSRREIKVECSDVVDFDCDVVVLKYAQAFFGADRVVSSLLSVNPEEEIAPAPDAFRILPTRGKIRASQAVFIGTVSILEFDYAAVREFASRAMRVVSQNLPMTRHVGVTLHGVGFGLDERESLFAEIAGLLDAFRDEVVPPSLERITIIERNPQRAKRIRQYLRQQDLSNVVGADSTWSTSEALQITLDSAGTNSISKPHIFVAMPTSDEMEDAFVFGVQGPANAAGYLCERVDTGDRTGDKLARLKARIDSASLVVADLTGANPNVYLEIGYAWGRGRPTLLIIKEGNEMGFDIQGQQHISYRNIAGLAQQLKSALVELLG